MNTAVFEQVYKFKGLSTETKPDCNSKGSLYEETDTGKIYRFDGTAWVEVEEDSGGGAMVVHFTPGEDDTVTADKTIAEIFAAVEAGDMICAVYPLDGSYMNLYAGEVNESYADFTAIYIGSDGYCTFYDIEMSIESDVETVSPLAQRHYDFSSLSTDEG